LKKDREETKYPDNDIYAPVGDVQGRSNGCVAHAISHAIMYYQNKFRGSSVKGSRLAFYYLIRWLLNQTTPIVDDNGSYLRTALKALAHYGIPPEIEGEYEKAIATGTINKRPDVLRYFMADEFKASSYIRLDPPGKKKSKVLADMKKYCDLGFPLVHGTYLYDSSYMKSFTSGIIEAPKAGELCIGGHALYTPAGYNLRAFRVGNSHKGWGDEKLLGWLAFDNILQGKTVDIWALLDVKYLEQKQFEQ